MRRLALLLYEEVEQIAELLDVNMCIADETPLEIMTGDDLDFFDQFKASIQRIRGNRTIFDAHAGELLDLPGYVPNALTRFHNRLIVNCDAMEKMLNSAAFTDLDDKRRESYVEAESLKKELRSFADSGT